MVNEKQGTRKEEREKTKIAKKKVRKCQIRTLQDW